MRLITGGFAQGKLEYVFKKYGYEKSDIFDAQEHHFSEWNGEPVINHAEAFVLQWLEEKRSPQESAKQFCENIGDVIFITQEMGCGLVPIGVEKRELREAVGKVNCIFADYAETVERVCCGLGMKIKG